MKTVSLQELADAQQQLGRKTGPKKRTTTEDTDPYRTRLRNREKADSALNKAQGALVLEFAEQHASEARSLFDHIERFRHLLNKPIRTRTTR